VGTLRYRVSGVVLVSRLLASVLLVVVSIDVVRIGSARRLEIKRSDSTKRFILASPQSGLFGWDPAFDRKVAAIRAAAAFHLQQPPPSFQA
jgi:hypothetical protein